LLRVEAQVPRLGERVTETSAGGGLAAQADVGDAEIEIGAGQLVRAVLAGLQRAGDPVEGDDRGRVVAVFDLANAGGEVRLGGLRSDEAWAQREPHRPHHHDGALGHPHS